MPKKTEGPAWGTAEHVEKMLKDGKRDGSADDERGLLSQSHVPMTDGRPKPRQPRVNTSVSFSPEIFAKLDALCARYHLSRSNAIAQLVVAATATAEVGDAADADADAEAPIDVAFKKKARHTRS